MLKRVTRLLLLLFVVAFYGALWAGLSRAQNTTHLRVGIYKQEPMLRYMPLISAYHNGYFIRKNLDVEIVPFTDSQEMIEDLASGGIDFAVSYPLFTLVAREYDVPVKVIGLLAQGLLHSGYTTNKELTDITDIKKLQGLKIGMLPDDDYLGYHFNAFMRSHAENFKDTQLVIVPLSEQKQLLDEGKADIVIGIEPELGRYLAVGAYHRSFAMDTFLGKASYLVISANAERIARNKPVAQAFITAIEEAMIGLKTDERMALNVARKAYPDWSESDLKASVGFINKHSVFPGNIVLSKALWEQSQTPMLDSGYLLKRHPYEDAVDPQFF